MFDTRSRRWSAAAPLPSARGGHAAVVLDGKIHVLGGGNQLSTLADHSVYDPATNRWAKAAPLPRPEGSVAAVALDGRIVAIGGRSGLDDYGNVYFYDPRTGPLDARPEDSAARDCGRRGLARVDLRLRRRVAAHGLGTRRGLPSLPGRDRLGAREQPADPAQLRPSRRLPQPDLRGWRQRGGGLGSLVDGQPRRRGVRPAALTRVQFAAG